MFEDLKDAIMTVTRELVEEKQCGDERAVETGSGNLFVAWKGGAREK